MLVLGLPVRRTVGEQLSKSIKEKLQKELDELETELRVHLPKEIKRSLEFGD